MSVVQAVITSGTQTGETVDIEVPTVRIPELSDAETPIEDTDLILLYKNDPTAKTRKTTAAELRLYMQLGNQGEPTVPVVYGANVEVIVNSENGGGTDTITVPLLAGELFTLNRQGIGDLLSTEFTILPGGGFKLAHKNSAGKVVDEDDPDAQQQIIAVGERFTCQVFSLVITGTESGNSSGSGGNEYTGIALITSDTQLNSIHRSKLIHCINGNVTLEDLTDVPKNVPITIETLTSAKKQTKIATKSNQAIYFGGTSQTYLYLGISESIRLLPLDDGYYVISPAEFLLNICQPFFDFGLRLNSLVCNGQLVLRSDYPRAWDWLQAHPDCVVNDTTWNQSVSIPNAETGTVNSYKPYEGCFSTGTITTGPTANFRLPNLQGKFMRGLNSITQGNGAIVFGSDGERLNNKPGGVQYDLNRKHKHEEQVETAVNNGGRKPAGFSNTLNDLGGSGVFTGFAGGIESRPINAGLIPLIHV